MTHTDQDHEKIPDGAIIIPGYPNYAITSNGVVYSKAPRGWHTRPGVVRIQKWRRLKLHQNRDGYVIVQLCNKDGQPTITVHKLVMLAFVGACPNGMEVCHSNGIRLDNRLCNLRYGTPVDNAADSRKHGTSTAKLNEEKSKQIKILLREGKSLAFLARTFGVHYTAIRKIREGQSWKHVV